MIKGLLAYVELEHEIGNSLTLIRNTLHKRCSVASDDLA